MWLKPGSERLTWSYHRQGAELAFGTPLYNGSCRVSPVICSAALGKGHPNPRALDFINFLFRPEIQSNVNMSPFYFRSVLPPYSDPIGGTPLPAPGAVTLNYDWSQWATLESALPKYVIGG